MTLHYIDMFVAATLVLGCPSVVMAQTITFANAAIGSKPKDFEPALTGRGGPGNWEIVADSTSPDGKALTRKSSGQSHTISALVGAILQVHDHLTFDVGLRPRAYNRASGQ